MPVHCCCGDVVEAFVGSWRLIVVSFHPLLIWLFLMVLYTMVPLTMRRCKIKGGLLYDETTTWKVIIVAGAEQLFGREFC